MSTNNGQGGADKKPNANEESNNAGKEKEAQVENSSQSTVSGTSESKKLRYTRQTLRIPPPLLHDDASNSTIEITESFVEPENMIDLTVKTLDSQNHPFHVEDDITIRQFKEKISECLNIPPDSQRLIFCGRVLQDDKKLSEYGLVSGNTVHMVQRPPPQSGSQSRSQTRESGTGTSTTGSRNGNGIRRSHTFRMRPSNVDRNAMYLGAMAYPADLMEAQGIQLPQPSSSLCASRLNIARRMLRRAGDVLSYLENPQSQPPPRNTPSPTTVQVSQAIEVIEVGIGQIDDSMDEGNNIAEAATAAAISAAVSAAQEVGAPNITIYRGSNNTAGSNETVIHIEATDNSENSGPQDDSMAEDNSNENTNATAENNVPTVDDTNQAGHSRSSSTDSFSSATEFPVVGSTSSQSNTANQNAANETSTPEANGASTRPTNESGTPPNTPLAPLAVLLDELNGIQTRLQPFMSQYHNILLTDPTYADHAAAVDAQRVYNRVSQVMHLLSHAYHAISDLMVDLHASAPRYLRCRPILIQHSAVVQTGIPIQAEFNISNMMAEAAAATGNAARAATAARNSETQTNNATARTVGREEETTNPPTAPTATATAEATTPVVSQATTHQQPTQSSSTFTFQPPPPQQGSHRQNFGFALPDGLSMGGNVEVVMEVTPRYGLFNVDNSGGAPTANSTGGNGMGVTIPIQGVNPTNEMMSNIMQAVAGQIINRMHGGTVGAMNVQATTQTNQAQPRSQPETTSTGAAAQNNANHPGQNSQARVNTATHPTTSTQTRSTARPHVQLRPAQLRLPLGGHLGGVTSSFDPFLPCNSHHLRARRRNTNSNTSSAANTASSNSNENATVTSNTATATSASAPTGRPCGCTARRSMPFRTSSSGGQSGSVPTQTARRSGENNAPAALLRDVFASQIVTDTLQNAFVEVQESGNLILDFIVQLVRRTPLNEVFTMLMGDPSPLVRLRPIIRQFLITRLLENNTPTEESFTRATERIIDGVREHFRILETIPMRDQIDLSATLMALTRARVPNILALAVNEGPDPPSGPTYGSRLMSAVRDFVSVFVGTVMYCCENGTRGAEEVFRRYVDYVSRGADANLLMFTMSYSVSEFRHYMNTVDMNQPDIRRYIVYKNQAASDTGTSQQPQSMEVEEIAAPVASAQNLDTPVSSLASTSASSVVCNSSQPVTAARNVIKVPKTTPPTQANNEIQPSVVLPPIEMDLDAAEPVSNVVLGSQQWHNALPPDWVPIITRDVVRQRRQNTQSPMSDAYLQGMPSKRRKLINGEKRSANVVQSLQDTVRHTIQSVANQVTSNTGANISEIVAQAAQDSNLLNAYREQIRSSLRNRLQQDPDFNPALYPNSEQKFK